MTDDYRTADVGVIRLGDGKHIKPGTPEWNEYGAWITAGNVPWPPITPATPGITQAELIESYRLAIQNHLDFTARLRQYDNIQTAALRAALPNSPFHGEGVAYGEWMDACWAKGIEVMNAVLNNEIPAPSEEQLIAQLPELILPER